MSSVAPWAQGNGLTLYKEIKEVYYNKLKTSDHCDFENPSGFLCYLFCRLPHHTFSRAELRQNIVSLATAAMLIVSEENPWAREWWNNPQNY